MSAMRACLHFQPMLEGKREIRQHNSGVLHQQSKGDEVTRSVYGELATLAVGHITSCELVSNTHLRSSECSGRQVVSALPSRHRMVPEEVSCEGHIFEDGRTNDRSLCDRTGSDLLFQTSRPTIHVAFHVDALTLNWDGLVANAFPPFSLIHLILDGVTQYTNL